MDEAPSRVKAGVLIRAGVCLFFAFAGLMVLGRLFSSLGYLLSAVLGTFAAGLLANLLALRIWERRPLTDIGLHWNAGTARNLGLGFAGGAAAAAAVLGLPVLGGSARLVPAADPSLNWGTFLFVTLVLLFGALGEEILFRGYAFQILVPTFGAWATILPMGVLFGAAHSLNLSVTHLGLANTMAWGVLLGYSVVRSGDLWLAIGLHFGWNWILPLFGVNVSGFKIRVLGYALEWNLAPVWSGGEYGPEGGLLCTAVLVVLAGYLVWAPVVRQEGSLVARSGKEREGL